MKSNGWAITGHRFLLPSQTQMNVHSRPPTVSSSHAANLGLNVPTFKVART